MFDVLSPSKRVCISFTIMNYRGSANFLSAGIAKGNNSLEPSTKLICGRIIMPRKHKHASEMQPWLKIHRYSVDLSWRHMAFDCLAFSILTGSLWDCIIDEKTHFTLLNMWALCVFLSPPYLPYYTPLFAQRLNSSIKLWSAVCPILSERGLHCLSYLLHGNKDLLLPSKKLKTMLLDLFVEKVPSTSLIILCFGIQ